MRFLSVLFPLATLAASVAGRAIQRDQTDVLAARDSDLTVSDLHWTRSEPLACNGTSSNTLSRRAGRTYTWKEMAEYQRASVQAATMSNLAAAQRRIARALDANRMDNTIMGGFSLALRGNPRPTADVDMAVRGPMATLRQILSAQDGVVLPANPTEDVLRIFVDVGDRKCSAWVMMDVKIAGKYFPSSLGRNQPLISLRNIRNS
jgi:hypothetical protein